MCIFKSINAQFRDIDRENNSIDMFYIRITKVLLQISAYFITPLMLLGSIFFYRNMSVWFMLGEITIAVFLLGVVYVNGLKLETKRFLVLFIFYVTSVSLLILTGTTGAGLVSIMTSVTFIALLTRASGETKTFYIFNIVVFVFITIWIYAGWFDSFQITMYKPTWPIVAVSMLVFVLGIILSIEHYKHSMIELYEESEMNYRFLDNAINSLDTVLFAVDAKGDITFYNNRILEFTDMIDLRGKNYKHLFEMFLKLQSEIGKQIENFEHISINVYSSGDFYYELGGKVRYVNRTIYDMIGDEGKVVVIRDITESIEKKYQLEYLTTHDELTGLLNRKQFNVDLHELEVEEVYPLSMMIIDLNGLALINESFGYKVGDQFLKRTAEVMYRCTSFRVYRIGGDEFAIIAPGKDINHIKETEIQIKEAISKQPIKNIDISISTGLSERKTPQEPVRKIMKRMDDDLGTAKLSESSSMRSKTISLILDTLYEKNQREMAHSKRVSIISRKLAEAMDMDSSMVARMELSGLMHDIGKIGVEEFILNKKGILLEEEWKKIQKHPEIGYRILSSHNEFSDIANFVLEHHENYDGTGYPNGLSGEDIELGARIVCVADAFDAMTGPRTYKASLSKEDALQELISGKGTQFDPDIVGVFIDKVVKEL